MSAQGIEERVTADTLFVGMARPMMVWRVTLEGFVLNGLITAELFIYSGNAWWLLICFPVHGVLVVLCTYEPRFFDILKAWGNTAKANDYGPFALSVPDRKGRRARPADVRVIV